MKISVVTVTLNAEKHLKSTIKSIVNQKAQRDDISIEYIVIDGGSFDGTINIINEHEDTIKYWISEPDRSIYDAMNKGWAAADEDSYILFLGAGDLILSLPTSAELQSFGEAIMGVGIIGNLSIRSRVDWSFRIRSTIHHQALLLHKSLSVIPPFNPIYNIAGDSDFNIRLIKQNVNYKFTDSLCAYVLPDGVSSTASFREWGGVVRSHFGIFWMAMAFLYYHLIVKSNLNYYLRRWFPFLSLTCIISSEENKLLKSQKNNY
jgi:glycosyltransferase involved in cell wall biosynthesis